MKSLFNQFCVTLIAFLLSSCLASTTSVDGVACNNDTRKGPVWTWPLICQPNGG